MKTSVTNKLKKVLAGIMLVAVPVFVSCEKDNEKPNNNGGNNQPQQRTEEFVYDYDLNFWREGNPTKIAYTAFGDTVAKYANDDNVKQIHIIPNNEHMYDAFNSTKMQTRANILDGIHTQSNSKLSGENTTLYLEESAFNNQTVQQVLNNKLKIALMQR